MTRFEFSGYVRGACFALRFGWVHTITSVLESIDKYSWTCAHADFVSIYCEFRCISQARKVSKLGNYIFRVHGHFLSEQGFFDSEHRSVGSKVLLKF